MTKKIVIYLYCRIDSKSRKSEVGSRKPEVGSRKSEAGSRKSENKS